MALSMYPLGLKDCFKMDFLSNAPFERFSLAMYPSDQILLKASILRALRGDPAKFSTRYVDKALLLVSMPFQQIPSNGFQ